MLVLVSGSREGFTYIEFLFHMQQVIGSDNITQIVAGGAKGIDAFAKRFAKDKGIKYTEFPANWDNGLRAGLDRNVEMGDFVKGWKDKGRETKVMAFCYNYSTGTSHMIRYATKLGLDTHVISKNDVDMDFD